MQVVKQIRNHLLIPLFAVVESLSLFHVYIIFFVACSNTCAHCSGVIPILPITINRIFRHSVSEQVSRYALEDYCRTHQCQVGAGHRIVNGWNWSAPVVWKKIEPRVKYLFQPNIYLIAHTLALTLKAMSLDCVKACLRCFRQGEPPAKMWLRIVKSAEDGPRFMEQGQSQNLSSAHVLLKGTVSFVRRNSKTQKLYSVKPLILSFMKSDSEVINKLGMNKEVRF